MTGEMVWRADSVRIALAGGGGGGWNPDPGGGKGGGLSVTRREVEKKEAEL